VGLLDQIERAAGVSYQSSYAHELMEMHGVEPKEFWSNLERKGRTVDIRASLRARRSRRGH